VKIDQGFLTNAFDFTSIRPTISGLNMQKETHADIDIWCVVSAFRLKAGLRIGGLMLTKMQCGPLSDPHQGFSARA
jgi:hypothetical protein